jgi:hypothetical protein
MFFAFLSQTYICYGLSSEVIDGVVKDESNKGLPGILVKLYDARTNHLEGETLSDENGSFHLNTPQRNGNFYVRVLTEDREIHKVNFAHNIDKPLALNLIISLPRNLHKNQLAVAWEEAKPFVPTFLGFLGIILGWGLKTLSESRKEKKAWKRRFKRCTKEIHNLVENIKGAFQQSNDLYSKHKGYDDEYLKEIERQLKIITEKTNELNKTLKANAKIFYDVEQDDFEQYCKLCKTVEELIIWFDNDNIDNASKFIGAIRDKTISKIFDNLSTEANFNL